MSTFTADIAKILQDNGFGVIGSTIFVGDDIDPEIAPMIKVRSLGTVLPDSPIHSLGLSHPSVDVIILHKRWEYAACELEAEQINVMMSGVRHLAVGTSRYINIINIDGPTDIGLDNKMRPRFSIQFSCDRTPL
jgi:hypothetical protein